MSPSPTFDPSWIGFIAAILTTVSFAPQAIKAWRTRSTQDVSLTMFVMLVVGIMLWLTYGLLLNDMPLIAANTVTLVLAGAILAAKIRFR
ncbi:MAG: MtN3 and saliva related transmembrane protein [Alphaproteobacteria bacterium]|jgi:MtN3 and saliva related transmembrane protein